MRRERNAQESGQPEEEKEEEALFQRELKPSNRPRGMGGGLAKTLPSRNNKNENKGENFVSAQFL
jgi:hypothetical protein